MIQTIILFVAVFLIILSIYGTITKFRELNHGRVLQHSFVLEIIFISLGLTYIILYCN